MPKVRITNPPSGLLNGRPWPAAGEEIDVPDVVAKDLVAAGSASLVGRKASDDAEQRPLTPAAEVRGDSPDVPGGDTGDDGKGAKKARGQRRP